MPESNYSTPTDGAAQHPDPHDPTLPFTAVMGWRVWYVGGKILSSKDYDWDELPDDGVLNVSVFFNQKHPSGGFRGMSLQGNDYYFHIPGTEVYGSSNDPADEIASRYPGAIILRGKWTSYSELEWMRSSFSDLENRGP